MGGRIEGSILPRVCHRRNAVLVKAYVLRLRPAREGARNKPRSSARCYSALSSKPGSNGIFAPSRVPAQHSDRLAGWTQHIEAHYDGQGRLILGCDARHRPAEGAGRMSPWPLSQ